MPQAPDWLGDVLWLVLGLGLVAMLFGELRWLRGLRAVPAEHCRACGAELPPPTQGASPGGARTCDQCGAPVLTPSTAAAMSSNPLIAWLQQRPLAGVGAAWGLILWAVMSLAWPLLGGSGEPFQLVPALTGLPLFVLGGLVFGLAASAVRGRGD